VFGWSNGFVVFRETAVMTADDDSKSIRDRSVRFGRRSDLDQGPSRST